MTDRKPEKSGAAAAKGKAAYARQLEKVKNMVKENPKAVIKIILRWLNNG